MRDKQAVIAVIGVLVVVFGFVWVANVLTNRTDTVTPDATSTVQPTDSPTGTATSSPTPTVTPSLLAGCSAVPKPQAAPKKISAQPDLAAAKGKTFVGTITTTCGPITIELDGAKAPAAVSSFLLLAKENYYDPSPCHRLTGDAQGLWVLQCGDPTGTGSGAGPGYHFGVENAPANDIYPAGTLAMARKANDPNSNGDQFFIVYKDTKLPASSAAGGDGSGYTIFGKVTNGMDLVDRVAAAGINPSNQTSPLAPISILSVAVQPKA
ncbi:MAG: peptidylprolyl isomerase [Lapillicoccus sp.]